MHHYKKCIKGLFICERGATERRGVIFPFPCVFSAAISNFVATLNETTEKVTPHCSKLSTTLSGKGEVHVLCGVLGSLILAKNRQAKGAGGRQDAKKIFQN